MEIQTCSPQEALILERRFRAIAYELGPLVELTALLPDGRVLRSPLGGTTLAAQCASLNKRIEQMLQGSGGNR